MSITNILITLAISMFPIVELRGGLPIGVGFALHDGLNLTQALLQAGIVSIIGNLLPIPFILLLINWVLKMMKKSKGKLSKLAIWVEQKGERATAKIGKYEFWGLLIFVAIPAPGTGAWTGALVAALLRMKFKKAITAIILGVLGAAIIMSALSGIFVLPFIK